MTLRKFLRRKNNRNIFICGSSGSGKTYALTSILSRISETPIIVFSFKAQDYHLKLGFNTVDVSRMSINAFKSRSAFIKAFTVTFIHSEGYLASKIPVVLDEVLRKAGNWSSIFKYLENKLKSCKSDLDAETYLAIIKFLKSVAMEGNENWTWDFETNIVLDFSSLDNEHKKIFYAELILNYIWNELQQKPRKCVIAIDEAHRIMRAESVLNEMAREIRVEV